LDGCAGVIFSGKRVAGPKRSLSGNLRQFAALGDYDRSNGVARYTFGAYELTAVSERSFQQFVELAKGRSIVSLGDFGPDRVELWLKW
jgi:hypothetical protein